MTSFSLEVPADPIWLHLARAAATTGVSSMPTAHVDFLDDAILAIGESLLEVCVTPGVELLDVAMSVASSEFTVAISGRGESISYDESDLTVFGLVLEGLTEHRDVRRLDGEYSIRFTMSAPPHEG